MPRPDLAVLPDWAPGTVAVLSTGAGHPHAIPVSTALRDGDRRIVFALARRRDSLTRLRADPACALTVVTGPDLAFTAIGRAVELGPVSERIVALAIDVERIQDHGLDTFAIEAGVKWRWTDATAAARDAEVRAALAEQLRH